MLIERIAFVLGLALGPLLTWCGVGLDLLWTGVLGGVIAYGIHRWRRTAA